MKRGHSVAILFLLSLIASQAQDCFIQCMERSGCWSGGSVFHPSYCNNMPELCQIQCRGKTGNGWGAIAYSRKDKISGWSFEQAYKATAESSALRFCVKQGGGKCQVEASFNRTCGSVVADGDIVGWGTAATKADAQQRAVAECARAGGKQCAAEERVLGGHRVQ